MLHKLIYKIGLRYRNKKIEENLRFLLKSQCWPRERMIERQNRLLREIVSTAYSKSPYYTELFNRVGLKPEDINTTNDLELIPLTSKTAMLDNCATIQTTVEKEKSYYSETSGSTGKPLVFYRNQDWDAWHNASVFRGYSWYGVQPWERNGYLWGYNLSTREAFKTKILDFLQNRFRLFSYSDAEISKFCRKLKGAKYLNGYSSMIYELTKHIEKDEELKKQINLDFIKGTSEKIFESYQDKSREVFGKKIISEYGSAEAGIIAFECPEGNMHVNMETVIVEEIEKQIVITNLVSKSFPVIRYELGDYIELDIESVCGCGRESFIIKEVTGRVGDIIYGKEDTYPSLILYYVFKNIAVSHNLNMNYQVIQREKGKIEIYLEKELSDQERKMIEEEVIKYFSDDIDYRIKDQKNIISRDGKTKDFISELS